MKDNNSIEEVAQKLYPISDTNWTLKSERDAFIKGVEWLQSQPEIATDIELLDELREEIKIREKTILDYQEIYEDNQRLVKELDVIINGENAAPQASLCDIISQLRNEYKVNQKGNDSDAVEFAEWKEAAYNYDGKNDKKEMLFICRQSGKPYTTSALYKLFKQSKSLP